MPELPEIETIRRDLERSLLGGRVRDLTVYDRRLFTESAETHLRKVLLGQIWSAIIRKGKYLLVRLANDWTIVFHLRMTGQLVLEEPNHPQEPCRLRLHFDTRTSSPAVVSGGSMDSLLMDPGFRPAGVTTLAFRDQRRFGEVTLVRPGEELASLAKLGPDPTNGLSCQDFVQLLRGKTTRIKPLLMDQRVLAGVGNIYAQEALFKAAIRPNRPACRLSRAEAERLYESLRETLLSAIEHRGSSSRNYRDAYGKTGTAQTLHRVYRKGGQPCPRCQNVLRSTRVGGRGTVYCSTCQR